MTTLMILLFGLVSVRLYYLQVLHHKENVELADRNRIRIRRVPAPRGLVFDRNHRPLVDTRPSFDAVIVPEDSDNLSQTIERIERYTGADHIPDKISDAEEAGRPPYEPVTVAEEVNVARDRTAVRRPASLEDDFIAPPMTRREGM